MFQVRNCFFPAAMLAISLPAAAQDGGAAAASTAASGFKGFAAASLQAPVAFGAEWGSVGVGAYGETLSGADEDADGSAAFVFGLGDADEYVALEVAVVASSLTGANSNDSFGDSGSFGFKLHTNLGDYASYAIGVNGTNRWGSRGFKRSNESSVYSVVSKMVPVGEFAAILNVGLGENLYDDIGHQGVGVIGSGALYFTHWLSVIAEYTGRFTNAAVSIAPFPAFLPVTLTLGAVNLGERYNSNTEFAGTLGIGYSFY